MRRVPSGHSINTPDRKSRCLTRIVGDASILKPSYSANRFMAIPLRVNGILNDTPDALARSIVTPC